MLGIEMGAEAAGKGICGVLWEAAGESIIDPNWMFDPPTGPPFAI